MFLQKMPLKTLLILGLLSLGAAAPDIEIKDINTRFSEYLTAIYARQAGDFDRATENYLRVLKKDPKNLQLAEEAFTYFVFNGDYKNALDLAKDLRGLEDDHSSSAMLLALDAFRAGRKKHLDKVLPDAKGLGFDQLISPLMQAWLFAEEGKLEEALAVIEPLKSNPGFEPYYAEHRAFILDRAGRADEAEAAYLALLARPEITSLQPLFAYGAFLQKEGRNEDALKLYKGFEPSSPTNLQLKAAIKRLEEGKAPETIVTDRSKAVAMALLRAGVQLSQERAYYPGIIYARFALLLNPDFDEAWLFLGNMLSNEPHPDLALKAYQSVAADGPFYETGVLRQAFVYSFHDRTDEGIALVETYLKDHPDSYDALVTIGDLHRSEEQYAEALPYYERAMQQRETLTADDWFLVFTRGICYERLDRWNEAEPDLLKALEFQPDNPDVLNYLGYSWIDQGMHLKEGREMIEKAVKASPDNGFILDSLGWAQYLMGEYEEAVISLEDAVSIEPGDPTINDHLGDAYWKVGREREARFQWSHALALDPTDEVREVLNEKMESGLPADGAANPL